MIALRSNSYMYMYSYNKASPKCLQSACTLRFSASLCSLRVRDDRRIIAFESLDTDSWRVERVSGRRFDYWLHAEAHEPVSLGP